MAVHNYVLSKYVSGTSKSAIELDVNQLLDGDKYEIDNPKDLISDYIFAALESFINPQYTISYIRGLLDIDGKHKLDVCDYGSSDVIDSVIIKVNNKKQQAKRSFALPVFFIPCLWDGKF